MNQSGTALARDFVKMPPKSEIPPTVHGHIFFRPENHNYEQIRKGKEDDSPEPLTKFPLQPKKNPVPQTKLKRGTHGHIFLNIESFGNFPKFFGILVAQKFASFRALNFVRGFGGSVS